VHPNPIFQQAYAFTLAALSGNDLITGKNLSSRDNGYQIINVTATENNAKVAGALVVNVH
jgi:hypothetical protein